MQTTEKLYDKDSYLNEELRIKNEEFATALVN